MLRAAQLRADDRGPSEVGDQDLICIAYEQILRAEVTVEHALVVDELQPHRELADPAANAAGRKGCARPAGAELRVCYGEA